MAAATLASCGGGSDDPERQAGEVVWRKGAPVTRPNPGPPPKKLIVRDLRAGSGTTLKKDDIGTFRFRNFDYRTGLQYEDWWETPFSTSFGRGESLGAWETGLKGMKIGGRRELIVPAKQAYGDQPVIYVLELIAVR